MVAERNINIGFDSAKIKGKKKRNDCEWNEKTHYKCNCIFNKSTENYTDSRVESGWVRHEVCVYFIVQIIHSSIEWFQIMPAVNDWQLMPFLLLSI